MGFYEQDRNRIIVLDQELEKHHPEIVGETWQKIMRHVLGRHLSDIMKRGSGWSFPAHSIGEFERLLEKHIVGRVMKRDIGVQTEVEKSTERLGGERREYVHDIDPRLRLYAMGLLRDLLHSDTIQ